MNQEKDGGSIYRSWTRLAKVRKKSVQSEK